MTNTPHLDMPVEIAPDVFKPLGKCTADDLRAAMELLMVQGIRLQAAMEQMAAGQAPMCGWRDPSGTYCEKQAEFIRDAGDEQPDMGSPPLAVCGEHVPVDPDEPFEPSREQA